MKKLLIVTLTLLVACVMVFSACAEPAPTPAPTPTPAPAPSPTPAPTPVFGAGKVGNDFLFGNQPKGCELPCWQGLIIGQSDAGDIQATLDTIVPTGSVTPTSVWSSPAARAISGSTPTSVGRARPW